MVVIINVELYDYKKYQKNMYILFDEVICEIDTMENFNLKQYPGVQVVDMKGKILLPSFLNGHTHIYSTFARGINLNFSPNNFQDILDQLWWKIDREICAGTLNDSALMYGIESIKNGVGYIMDHNASGRCITGSLEIIKRVICDRLGLKGLFCYETSDRFSIKECISENVQFIDKKEENSDGLFGMHASMSLSDSSLEEIKKHVGNIPLHIHCAESVDDQKDSIQKYGMRVVERLQKFNLLNEDSLFVHCVHLEDNELELLKKNNITIAVNINSNMNNSVGIPDVKKMLDKDINVILGTDGLGSNIPLEYITLVNSGKHRGENPCAFDLLDMKRVIQNGYRYISKRLQKKVGEFKIGYSADFQSFEYQAFTNITPENVLAHVFYGIFYNLKPEDMFMDGRWIMKSREIIGFDMNEYDESLKSSMELWEKIKRSDDDA